MTTALRAWRTQANHKGRSHAQEKKGQGKENQCANKRADTNAEPVAKNEQWLIQFNQKKRADASQEDNRIEPSPSGISINQYSSYEVAGRKKSQCDRNLS